MTTAKVVEETIKKENRVQRTRGEKTFDVFNTIFMVLLSFVTIYPFWYVLVLSLNTGTDAASGPMWFWPRQFTLENYYYVFQYEDLRRAFVLTVLRCVIGPVIQVFICLLAAYALSKRTIPGRKTILFFFMLPLFIQGSTITNYIVMAKLNVMNTFWVYVIPGAFSFFNMVIMRTFIEGIPPDLEESARIDGAGNMVSFMRIVLPLCKPVIAAFFFFGVVSHWLDLYTNLIYVTDRNLRVLQYILYIVINSSEANRFMDMNSMASEAAIQHMIDNQTSNTLPTPEVIKMAVMVVVTFPLLFIYPFFQRYFVRGMMVGAIKA